MVWLRGAEQLHDARERRLHSGAHVDRLGGQPSGVNADQRSHSRSQAAHDAADFTGQCTSAVALPSVSSRRMSRAGICASGCTSSAMKSGIGKVRASADFGDAALRSSVRHLCTTSAFRLYKLEGKDSQSVVNALIKNARKLPQDFYKSLIWNRGTEMHGHKRFTMATDIQVYFCDPESPWQRGSNENTNGLLPQYMPSGCADATVGLRRPGHFALAFSREAADREAAVALAIAQVT